MALKLSMPLIKEFSLAETDQKYAELSGTVVTGEPTSIAVRQAETGENEARNALFSRFQREYTTDTVKVTQDISFDAVRRKEVFLTLAGCNITDTGDKPVFIFKNGRLDNEEVFARAWAKLPPLYADAIHEKVLDVNIMWRAEVGEEN
jgi:hypothetical protein